MAMLALGRYANWSRSDLRQLTVAELEAYALAARALEQQSGS